MPAMAVSQGADTESQEVSIEAAGWLTGCWRMDVGRHRMEEQWMAPAGGAMLGMNRALRDDEFRSYELLILRPREGRLVYEAHPSGQEPAEFASTHVSDTLLVFENPSHDFPQKLVYRRTVEDSILVGVFGNIGDQASSFDVPLARVACGETPDSVPRGEASMEIQAADNFITAYPALSGAGMAHAVIEIPAGTNAKWEVVEPGTTMVWEIEDGLPRVIDYLAYPANYGMIPRTALPTEMGGDGDPLDVVVLGPPLSRGSVVAVRPVGVLRLLDDGERDDKIIAVQDAGPLSDVGTFSELESRYPGLTEIIRIWFTSYKGSVPLESTGYGDESAAMQVIREASGMFEKASAEEAERQGAGGR